MKLLWLFTINDARLLDQMIELSSRIFIRNPEIEQCIKIHGNVPFLIENLFQNGIKIVYNNSLELKRVLNIFDPDTVLVFGSITTVLDNLNMLNKIKKCKIVSYVSIHRKYCKKLFIEQILDGSSKMIVTSDGIRENITQMIGKEVNVLPLGFLRYEKNNKTEAREIISKHGLNLRDKFVVFNGNPNMKRQRLDIFIKACVLFHKQNKNVVFLLTCDPNNKYGWDLNEIIKFESGDSDCFKFITINNESLRNLVLSCCDICVHTCDGIDVPIEAARQASAGIPQIIGNYSGYKEYFMPEFSTLVDHYDEYSYPNHGGSGGGEGFILNKNDVVSAMQRYYDDRSMLNEHGVKSFFHFNEMKVWDRVYNTFKDLVLYDVNKKNEHINENFILRNIS